MIIPYQPADVVDAFLKLFPQWEAFNNTPNNVFTNFATGLVDGGIAPVITETAGIQIDTFPSTTVSLIPEWQETLNLPDPLIPAVGTSAKQAQITARLQANDSPTIPFFQSFVAGLAGCTASQVMINVFFPHYPGLAYPGVTPLAPLSYGSYWVINIPTAYSSAVSLVQGEVGRIAPAHTTFTVSLY